MNISIDIQEIDVGDVAFVAERYGSIILLTSTVKNTSQSYQQLYQGTWIKTVKHALKIDIDLKDLCTNLYFAV